MKARREEVGMLDQIEGEELNFPTSGCPSVDRMGNACGGLREGEEM